ncbi:MAG: X2-like carbohydrate binding domain-containing protein [Bacillota bacterium]|nr:X2-like carbohydrate binding domain-containing protein [Bacillota bacterium]
MLKRFIAYLLCVVMLAGVMPFDMLAETADPSVTEQQALPNEEAASVPAVEPPAQQPVVSDPPAQQPVVSESPDQPPAVQEPAAEEPAAEQPPAEQPAAGEPEAGEPEAGEPEAGEPEAGEPETGEPEAGEPEAGEPEAGEPEAGEPEAGEPEAGEPEAGEPEAGEPEAGEPEAGEPEAGELEGEEPEGEEPEGEEPEIGETPEEDRSEETIAVYFDPQRAEYDLASPEKDIDIALLEGAPAFLGIEGLNADTDYRVSGSTITLLAAWLNAQAVGEATLSFLFEGEEARPFYLNIIDSSDVEEAASDEGMALMAGAMRGIVFSFSRDSIEETRYFNSYNASFYTGIYQYADVSAHGIGTWTLSNVSGGAVESLEIDGQSPDFCNLRVGEMVAPGVTTATLTYSVGEYSQDIPVTITISNATVPTSLDMPSVFQSSFDGTLNIPRPGLLPADTGLDAANFSFYLSVHGANTQPSGNGGYDLTFTEAGYLQGFASMSYSNVYVSKNFIVEVSDASGTVPGTLLEFMDEMLEKTIFYSGETVRSWLNAYLKSDVSAYGTPEYSVQILEGDSVGNFSFNTWASGHSVEISFDVLGYGDTMATLVCTVGEHTGTLPITIHVPQMIVPTALSMPSVFSGKVNELITVNKPDLLPSDQQLDKKDFAFDISVYGPDGMSEEPSDYDHANEAWLFYFSQPGYYTALVEMSYENICLTKNVSFVISDASGNVPGSPFNFSHDSVEETRYINSDINNPYTIEVYQWADVSAHGIGTWSLSNVNGSEFQSLTLGASTHEKCILEIGEMIAPGVTTATLTYTAGELSQNIPVKITISNEAVPTSLDMPSVFQSSINETLNITRPGLLPANTGFNPADFNFSLSYIDGANVEWLDNDTYKLSFTQAGYLQGTAWMSLPGLYLEKPFVVEVADASGSVPGSPFDFSQESIEETRYINSWNNFSYTMIFQRADVSAYGIGTWSLSNVTGDAIESLRIDGTNPEWCHVEIGNAVAVGVTTATITYTAGEISQDIPVKITVSDAAVPTDLDMPSRFQSSINETLIIQRPGLLPADTGFDAADFSFVLYYIDGADITWLDNDTYEVSFNQAGYLHGTVGMNLSGLYIQKRFVIEVADASGNVPGTPFNFSQESIEETIYLKSGNNYSYYRSINQWADVSAYGVGAWSLSDVTGGAIESLGISNSDSTWCELRIGKAVAPGITRATLTYTVGELSQNIPVKITVSDAAVPTSLDMPSVFQSSINETINIARPGLLPANTGFNPDDFSSYLYVDGADTRQLEDGSYDVTFYQAGYLQGRASMYYSGIYLEKNFVVEVKDASGTVPGTPIEFEEELLETTVLYTGQTVSGYLSANLKLNPSAYGTPVYTVDNVAGASASDFKIDETWGSGQHVSIRFKVNGFGDTTARLVCTVGGHTASVPILIHVPDIKLPTGIDMPSVFEGVVNEEIWVDRPDLLPIDQELDRFDFDFDIIVFTEDGMGEYPGVMNDDGSALVFTFSEPGYHSAEVSMRYSNLYFYKNITFVVADESGEVPGNPYDFVPTSLSQTLYLNGSSSTVGRTRLVKKIPDLGMGIWSLRKLDPDAPNLRSWLWVSRDRLEEEYELDVAGDLVEGVFHYEIVCAFDGDTTVIPVELTITSGAPASLSLEQSVFTIDLEEWFTLPRPQFDPGDTGIDGGALSMNIGGTGYFWDNADVDAGQRVRIFEPGNYNVTIYLEEEDGPFRIGIDVLLIVKNADGSLPEGPLLRFEQDAEELTINYPPPQPDSEPQSAPQITYYAYLTDYPYALGEVTYTLTNLTGDAVAAQLLDSSEPYCNVRFTALENSGESTFRLTASAGGYETEMTITVRIDTRTLPTAMTPLSPQTNVLAGHLITLARPELTPAGTNLGELFNYIIFFRSDIPVEMVADTEDEKAFFFTEPGYYVANLYMVYNNTYFSQQIVFTVSLADGPPPNPILITEMYFDKPEITLKMGEFEYLSPIIQPVNPSIPTLEWTSSDESVVKIVSPGRIRAVAPGEAVITASSQDGSGKSAQVRVTVPAVDMSHVAWQETTSFAFDGTEKSVIVTGLPEGVEVAYENNTATDIGVYTASATFTSDLLDLSGFEFDDLEWEITAPFDAPFRRAPKITKVETLSATTLKLTWTRVAGASGYNIYISARPNDSYTLLTSTTALARNITRLKAGNRYFFKVEAYDLIGGQKFGSSPWSTWAAGVPMARPTITKIASPSRRMVTLSWNKPVGAAGYQVMFATKRNGPYKAVRTQFTNTATFRGLKSGLTCYFKIRPYKKFYAYAYFGPESAIRVIRVK